MFFRLAGARVVANDAARLRFGVDDLVIERIGHGVEAVAAGHAEPVGVARPECIARATRTAPRLIVLQSAVHVVERLRVVDRDRVELSGDDALDVIPRASGVPRHVQPAVAAEDHLLRCCRR